MIPAKEIHVRGKENLVAKHEADSLDALFRTVHIVSKKKVPGGFPISKMRRKSLYCPCTSPQIVTGASISSSGDSP